MTRHGNPDATSLFTITDLHVAIGARDTDGAQREILHGLSLTLKPGEVVAIMGPNGSGKSTLANAAMGHPGYTVTGGSIALAGDDLTRLPPNERAAKGLFLSFQYPSEIPGVTLFNFLRTTLNAQRTARGEAPLRVYDFTKLLREKMALLKVDETFSARALNDGFSGGEKKRAETLQLALFAPRVAILDETDSGLDIDALKTVSHAINATRNASNAFLIITHYQRILDYVTPDRILILKDGRIVKEGGPELAHELERHGYEGL